MKRHWKAIKDLQCCSWSTLAWLPSPPRRPSVRPSVFIRPSVFTSSISLHVWPSLWAKWPPRDCILLWLTATRNTRRHRWPSAVEPASKTRQSSQPCHRQTPVSFTPMLLSVSTPLSAQSATCVTFRKQFQLRAMERVPAAGETDANQSEHESTNVAVGVGCSVGQRIAALSPPASTANRQRVSDGAGFPWPDTDRQTDRRPIRLALLRPPTDSQQSVSRRRSSSPSTPTTTRVWCIATFCRYSKRSVRIPRFLDYRDAHKEKPQKSKTSVLHFQNLQIYYWEKRARFFNTTAPWPCILWN